MFQLLATPNHWLCQQILEGDLQNQQNIYQPRMKFKHTQMGEIVMVRIAIHRWSNHASRNCQLWSVVSFVFPFKFQHFSAREKTMAVTFPTSFFHFQSSPDFYRSHYHFLWWSSAGDSVPWCQSGVKGELVKMALGKTPGAGKKHVEHVGHCWSSLLKFGVNILDAYSFQTPPKKWTKKHLLEQRM